MTIYLKKLIKCIFKERRKMTEQKKKFKVNIIDLAIVLIIVLAAAFVAIKFMSSNSIAVSGSKYVVTYYADECPDYSAKSVQVGDPISDEQKNISLGTVTDVKLGPSDSYGVADDGRYVKSSKDGYNSVYITTEVEGADYEHGVIVSSTKYGVGHSLTVRAGKAKIYLRVYDIQKVG